LLRKQTQVYIFGEIGGDVPAGENWKGQIDDVRMYNRALSAQEVKRLYNIGHTGP